jgi:hypothetical protein
MSETTGQEAPAVASETPTPEVAQVQATITPEADTQDAPGEETAEAKTFTQDELNDIVKKEKARAEAKAERRVLKALERLTPQQQPAQQQFQAPQDARPTRLNGEGDDAYLDRLTDWKLDQRDRASSQQKAQEQTQTIAKKTENMYAEAAKLPGFDREEFDALPLTPVLAETLIDSDQAAQLMAYMSAHPEDVARIAALSPARQAAEIGKLETKLATAPKTSKAPAPISPIGSRGSAANSADLANLPMDQYVEARKKQGARWAR